METTTDTKCSITLFDKSNSQIHNTIFQSSPLVLFAMNRVLSSVSNEQEPTYYPHKNLHQQS